MSENTVFCDERGDRGIGMSVKKAVMADTKADDDIEPGMVVIEHFCLQNRIAHIDTYIFAAFWNADRNLWNGAGLTSDAKDFKTVGAENFSCSAGFRQQPDTGGNADFFDF